MKASTVRHTTCEKEFVLKSIKGGIRLDGRQSYDYRNIYIQFGNDFGCCEVQLGDTRVLAQTSAELVKPIDTRPTEGQLFLNVELSPMASPAFENGRTTNQGIEINRLIERCLKESRPIDVESLCLVAGEKVWAIRVDILVLNDSGNILDCSCIAAICALAHFKHSDVTVTGNDIIIHSLDEKAAVPLNIHHMPICTTFGFIGEGDQIIIDPEEKEESIMSGQMTLSFNIHGELCCSQMSGGVALDYEQILQCAKIASVKAIEITELIKEALEEDRIKRTPAPVVRREGLKDPIMPIRAPITKTTAEPTEIDTDIVTVETRGLKSPNNQTIPASEHMGRGTAGIGAGGNNTWVVSDDSDDDGDITIADHERSNVTNTRTTKISEQNDEGDLSEEEDVVMLESTEMEYVPSEIPSRTVLSENALPDDNDNYDPDEPSFDKNLTLHSKENEKIKTKKKKRKKPKPGS